MLIRHVLALIAIAGALLAVVFAVSLYGGYSDDGGSVGAFLQIAAVVLWIVLALLVLWALVLGVGRLMARDR